MRNKNNDRRVFSFWRPLEKEKKRFKKKVEVVASVSKLKRERVLLFLLSPDRVIRSYLYTYRNIITFQDVYEERKPTIA